MIQDIAPHKLDNHFYPDRKPADNSFVMAFRHQEILVKGENFPRVSEINEELQAKLKKQFDYADHKCIPFFSITGADEMASGLSGGGV